MGLSACCVLIGAFLVLGSGAGLAAILGVFWTDLEKASLQKVSWFRLSNASSKDNVDPSAEGLFAGWILISTILTTILVNISDSFLC